MSHYLSEAGEVRELPDDLVAAWVAAGNPKAAEWTLLPPRPSDDATWSGEWVVPPPTVPASVSARQIRLWLIQRGGISLAAVDAAIDAISDQLQRDSVRVEWDYAPYVERSHPMLAPLAAALGLTEAQVDQAFVEAATI